jgi:hypothetical protein
MVQRPIESTLQVRSTFERTRDLLLHDPATTMGAVEVVSEREFVVEMSTSRADGRAAHEPVRLEILAVHIGRVSARWDLTWRAVDHARLFPVFRGSLTVWSGETTTLRLTGTYEPPLGVVGRFGDGVLGHRVARHAMENYLAALARRIDQGVPVAGGPWSRAEMTNAS